LSIYSTLVVSSEGYDDLSQEFQDKNVDKIYPILQAVSDFHKQCGGFFIL
jgi:hypothetical protein